MSKTSKFRVVREHEGERFYNVGETRIAADADVRHLVPHVLEPIGPAEGADAPEAKAEPAPANKSEPAAPANKARAPRKPRGE